MNANLLREALASARAQPVASIVTVLVVTGMMLVVMLTTGRTVGAEQQVLRTIDSAGSRSLVIRTEEAARVTAEVLDRLAGIEGIEWAGAFSSAIDARNGSNLDGARVPVRFGYGSFARLGIAERLPLPGELAFASPAALEQLGLVHAAGSITLTTGITLAVAGRIEVPDFLREFEPLVVIPQPAATADAISVLVVITERPDHVAAVSAAVLSVLAAEDPTAVSLSSSSALAELRALIEGDLGSFSRGLVLAVLGLTGGLVAVLLSGLVILRRKDFGRRRALGATRGFIVALLLTQTAILAAAGIALGVAASGVTLLVLGDPVPGLAFSTALGVLGLVTALVAALIPAVIASRRDPIRELRVA